MSVPSSMVLRRTAFEVGVERSFLNHLLHLPRCKLLGGNAYALDRKDLSVLVSHRIMLGDVPSIHLWPIGLLRTPLSNRRGAQERSCSLIAIFGQASAAFFARSVGESHSTVDRPSISASIVSGAYGIDPKASRVTLPANCSPQPPALMLIPC